MDKNTKYISYHLDNLRKQKGISVEEFVVDICTDRQFRRYVSGENVLPSYNISKFCDKLDVSLSDFFYSLSQRDRYDYGKLTDIYQLILCQHFNDANSLLQKIQSPKLLDKQNSKFYKYLQLRINYELGKISGKSMYSSILNFIDYNNLINSNLFSFIDILFLHLICRYEIKHAKTSTLFVLKEILISSEKIYISSENKTILPPIYANVSTYLGELGNIEDILSLAIEGINYCLKNNLTDSLPHLYYSKVLGYYHIEKQELAYLSAVECLSSCISANKTLFNTYYELIQKDLGSDPIKYFSHLDLKNLIK